MIISITYLSSNSVELNVLSVFRQNVVHLKVVAHLIVATTLLPIISNLSIKDAVQKFRVT
jgi:hypothetical protein